MIRLQKYIADCGVTSRRKAEELIIDGKIKVNGRVINELGTKVDNNDKVEYDGGVIKIESDKIYIALNKPVGYISSSTSRQGKSVLELIDIEKRVYPVGRLDKDSSGLIILTNDGELTNEITHPKYGSEKEYEVILNRPITDSDKKKLESPMIIEDKELQPARVASVKGNKVNLVLKEGMNRQIRKMMAKLSYSVIDLKRIRVGKLNLGKIKEGQWQMIGKNQIK
jgi:23S rRNA pseudouridine2605 synthase